MREKQAVVEEIRRAFGGSEFPGEHFLQGSYEGSEPYEEVGPFQDKTDWQSIDPAFLDAHASALSFFSEAGLRFFLPAYLIADLNDQLKVADPLFHLTNGFSDVTVQIPVQGRVYTKKGGKSELINPRRYGAATAYDYARYRLSIFAREEARAIVAYLEYKRDIDDPVCPEKENIDAALNSFWLERAQVAPSAASLREHIKTEQEHFAALLEGNEKLAAIVRMNNKLEMRTRVVGPYSLNTYAFICPATNRSVLVDPGAEPDALEEMLGDTTLVAILLTHTHPDHVGALAEIKTRHNAPVMLHRGPHAEGVSIDADRWLEDGDTVQLGAHVLRILYTPGHTADEICIAPEGDPRILVGDTVFEGGPGKTWSVEGFRTTLETLRQVILRWPDETTCHPGHGLSFRLGDRRAAIEQFLGKEHGEFFGDATWEM